MMDGGDYIDLLFGGDADPEYSRVPGSKRPRRVPAPVVTDEESWDYKPIKKTFKGREVEFFEIGALAKALDRPVNTLRRWEAEEHIPSAPYRLPARRLPDGSERLGPRLYSRAMVEAAVRLFTEAKQMGNPRVDWNRLVDLTYRLSREWTAIYERESA